MARGIANEVSKSLEKWFDDKVLEAEQILRSEVPVKTGALRDSITHKKTGKFSAVVGVDGDALRSHPSTIGGIDYSPYVWKGISKGYDIVPVRAKALRWVDDKGVHYAKRVHINPRPGNPFIERTIKRLSK